MFCMILAGCQSLPSDTPDRSADTSRAIGMELAFERAGGGSDANIYNGHGLATAIIATGMTNVHSTSEQVTLPAVNTVQPPPMPKLEATGGEPAATGQAYSTLRLLGLPADDGALRANNGTFSVNVELRPALRANHRLRLVLDGQPHGPATRGSQLQVVNADRGEHQLAVQVLAGEQVIQQSESHTFTVQRVNTGSPALRPPPPQPKPTPSPAPSAPAPAPQSNSIAAPR